MNYQLTLTQFPSGKYGFVGSVPVELAFMYENGLTVESEIANEVARSSSPALVMKKYNIKTALFESTTQAINYAILLGIDPDTIAQV